MSDLRLVDIFPSTVEPLSTHTPWWTAQAMGMAKKEWTPKNQKKIANKSSKITECRLK